MLPSVDSAYGTLEAHNPTRMCLNGCIDEDSPHVQKLLSAVYLFLTRMYNFFVTHISHMYKEL